MSARESTPAGLQDRRNQDRSPPRSASLANRHMLYLPVNSDAAALPQDRRRDCCMTATSLHSDQ
jgi:hypothetical protein